MTPEELDEAQRLLRAARSDLRALETLARDEEQENDVLGFHAQQAVEKSTKAVLLASGAEIPFSHDLSFLFELGAELQASVPDTVSDAEWLTPWAVAVRYGASGMQLDRTAAIAAARVAVDWAAAAIRAEPGEPAR